MMINVYCPVFERLLNTPITTRSCEQKGTISIPSYDEVYIPLGYHRYVPHSMSRQNWYTQLYY